MIGRVRCDVLFFSGKCGIILREIMRDGYCRPCMRGRSSGWVTLTVWVLRLGHSSGGWCSGWVTVAGPVLGLGHSKGAGARAGPQ